MTTRYSFSVRLAAVLLAGALCVAVAAERRSVEGVVAAAGKGPIEGAVVKIKDRATLQIRSFVTQQDGRYYFRGLNPNTDYEVVAERGGFQSDSKNVSRFDSKEVVVVNFNLRPAS
jgi:hypothetical protein